MFLAGVSSVATPLMYLASLLLLHVRLMFLILYFAVSSIPDAELASLLLLKPALLLGFLMMLHARDVPGMSTFAGVSLLLKFTLLLGFLLMLHARVVPGMSTVPGVLLLLKSTQLLEFLMMLHTRPCSWYVCCSWRLSVLIPQMFLASLLLLLFRDAPDMSAVAGVPFISQIRAVAASLLLLLDLPSMEVEGGLGGGGCVQLVEG
jgi:hypothetical protein